MHIDGDIAIVDASGKTIGVYKIAKQFALGGIVGATTNMQDVLLQYRLAHRDDPHLRLWAGLILRQRRRPAVAASEFKASMARGCDSPRVRHYFRESVMAARGELRAS